MDAIRTQYIHDERLHALKVVVSGPPCSGKSAFARYIAGAYSLPLLTLADIKAAASELPATDAQALRSAATLSPAQLAQLSRAALSNVCTRNRGFVLDACPSTLREAREIFTDPREWTEQERADAEEIAAMTAQTEASAAAPAKGAKGAKGTKPAKGDKPGSARAQSAVDNVEEPRRVLESLMPNVLVRRTDLCAHHTCAGQHAMQATT